MNDATIRQYLRSKIDRIARDVMIYYQDIKGLERQIQDKHDKIALLKVHYTSLINTMLAYGGSEEQMRDEGWVTIE